MAEQKNFINVKIAVIVCKKKNAVGKGNRKFGLNEELTKFLEVLWQPEQHSRSTAAYEPKYPVGR